MQSVIHQSEILPASAEALFDQYTDASLHAAITGAPVTIGRGRDCEFCAFDGALRGTILETIRSRLVVQSWRSSAFRQEDADSTPGCVPAATGIKGESIGFI